MAINALFCINDASDEVNFSGQSISAGTYITVSDFSQPTPAENVFQCAQVIGGDETGAVLSATTETYTSCYECLVDNYTVIGLTSCDGNDPNPNIMISEFGFIPVERQVIYMEVFDPNRGGVTYTKCFQVGNIEQVSEQSFIDDLENTVFTINQIIFSNFNLFTQGGCEQCLNGFSAGTESTICVVCCPCTTGETISSVSAPHPTWTNGQGQAVIQLNAITLGGPNGLNN